MWYRGVHPPPNKGVPAALLQKACPRTSGEKCDLELLGMLVKLPCPVCYICLIEMIIHKLWYVSVKRILF